MSSLKPDDTVITRLRHWSVTSPDTPAFIFTSGDGHREMYTRRGIYSVALRCASWLKEQGLRKGDVVALFLPAPSSEQTVLTMGLNLLGATPLPIAYIMFRDGQDLVETLDRGDVSALIVDPGDENCVAVVREHLRPLEGGQVSCPAVPTLRSLVYCQTRYYGNQTSFLRDLEKKDGVEEEGELPACCHPDDVAVILSTSGTTGKTKLVSRTHREALRIGEMICEAFCYNEGEVVYNSSNGAWITGYLGDYSVNAPTRVILCKTDGVDDPILQLWQTLCREQPVAGLLTPGQLRELVRRHSELQAHGHWRARVLGTGGGPVKKDCLEALGLITEELRAVYGSTEIGVGNCYKIYIDRTQTEEFNIGQPIQGQEFRILDENFQEVGVGMRGQLTVRNDVIFAGYLKQPLQTQEVTVEGGWYLTGDCAWRDDKGDYFVDSRVADSFLVEGFPLYPELLESTLHGHPGILEAAVVGIPDVNSLNRPCVCLVRVDNEGNTNDPSNNDPGRSHSNKPSVDALTEEGILNMYTKVFHGGGLMNQSLLPKWCLFFDRFPRSWNGKLRRKELRAEAMKRLGISD